MPPTPPTSHPHPLREVFASFSKLGLISFGGPVAHLSYLRAEFVEKRRWLDDAHYADLVALCQFLPGPASSQVVFALGLQRAGLLGGLLASACFTLPSAIIMIAFAYGIASLGDPSHAGWLRGLKLAAVAVVAHAVLSMAKSLCPDSPRLFLAIAAAAFLALIPTAWAQIVAIAIGAFAGWLLYRRDPIPPQPLDPEPPPPGSHLWAAIALAAFFALLIILPLTATYSQSKAAILFDSFYRVGALVFGGGHVALPLLGAAVIPPGWVTQDQFLAGYGMVQAVPGPLFSFSAYLGALTHPGPYAWATGIWCLLAVFLPSWLLVAGALPFWHRLRARHWAQSALKGANAAVVGLLLAALYSPVITEGVHNPADALTALAAFGVLYFLKPPSWLLVAVLAAAGQWLLPA